MSGDVSPETLALTLEQLPRRDFQVIYWKDKEWEVRPKGNLRILTLPKQPQDYCLKAGKIEELVTQASTVFSGYRIPQSEKPLIFQIAIIPDNSFRALTGVSEQYPWAKAVSRSLDSERVNVTCYSDGIVDTGWLSEGTPAQPDKHRGKT